MDEYLNAAKGFAKLVKHALDTFSEEESGYTVQQNAYKAVEFALYAYSIKTERRVPRTHASATTLAYSLGKMFGESFEKLLDNYRGAYVLRDGERAKESRELMLFCLDILSKRLDYAFL